MRAPAGSLRVLVVEDDPTQQRFAQAALAAQDEGFDVTLVGTLMEAREALAWQATDLVLLDLDLPDSQGLPTLEAIRREHPLVPVVVLSGEEGDEVAMGAVKLGAEDYLLKGHASPFLLRRALRQAHERKRVEEELLSSRIERPLVRVILNETLQRAGLPPAELSRIGELVAQQAEARSLDALLRAFERMGLGGSLTCDHQEEGRYRFSAADLVERRRQSASTTCYLTLGFLRGAVSRLHQGASAMGSEMRCQSRGDARCEFDVRVKGK